MENVEHKHYVDQQAALRDILGSLPAPPSSTINAAKSGVKLPHSPPKLGGECIYNVLEQWIRDRKLPLLGASPDGLIRHADGRVEVLEVKCTSPFISYSEPKSVVQEEGATEGEESGLSGAAKRGRTDSGDSETPRMTISHGFGANTKNKASVETSFGVWHVVQLQLEMLCVGAHCRSAVMLRYCISGAKLYRIERDDVVHILCVILLCMT